MRKQFLHTSFVLSLSLLVSVTLVPQASADTAEVTGNGAESNNQVQNSSSTETHVQSNNDAAVHNNVQSNANTGANNTSGNTGGDQKIVTGNATTNNEVKTTANTSVVDTSNCNCENKSSTTTVTGNGAGSQNTASNNSSSSTTASVNNTAKITNNISINANTGNNTAGFNTGGNTIIKTGNINVTNSLDNGPINVAKVKVQGNNNTTISSFLKIAGNGAFSENKIKERNNTFTDINVNNIADIFNDVHVKANTGNNIAEFNTGGDTIIITGNVDVQTLINNVANFSLVEIVCGCEKKPTPEKPVTPGEQIPQTPSAPSPPTTSVGGPGTPGTSSGPGTTVAAAGSTLPVTGNNVLFFTLLASILMFFLGTILRLRSGRSPGYSFSL